MQIAEQCKVTGKEAFLFLRMNPSQNDRGWNPDSHALIEKLLNLFFYSIPVGSLEKVKSLQIQDRSYPCQFDLQRNFTPQNKPLKDQYLRGWSKFSAKKNIFYLRYFQKKEISWLQSYPLILRFHQRGQNLHGWELHQPLNVGPSRSEEYRQQLNHTGIFILSFHFL